MRGDVHPAAWLLPCLWKARHLAYFFIYSSLTLPNKILSAWPADLAKPTSCLSQNGPHESFVSRRGHFLLQWYKVVGIQPRRDAHSIPSYTVASVPQRCRGHVACRWGRKGGLAKRRTLELERNVFLPWRGKKWGPLPPRGMVP